MADDALQLVRMRNDFYRDNYRRVLGLLLIAILTVVILAGTLIYLVTHPPEPKYFATDSQGRLLPVAPLNEPNLSTAAVLQWAQTAVVSAFTFDFANYRSQLQSVSQYFTTDGWQEFQNALQSSGNINTVTTNRMVVSAVATGAPVVTREGILDNHYAWRITMPMLITYQSTRVSQQNVIASILVIRISTLTNPKGIGIAQLILNSTGSLNNF